MASVGVVCGAGTLPRPTWLCPPSRCGIGWPYLSKAVSEKSQTSEVPGMWKSRAGSLSAGLCPLSRWKPGKQNRTFQEPSSPSSRSGCSLATLTFLQGAVHGTHVWKGLLGEVVEPRLQHDPITRRRPGPWPAVSCKVRGGRGGARAP